MDEIDQAQNYEEMHRENALREYFRKRDNFKESVWLNPGPHPTGAGLGGKRICKDCGEEIEPARLKAMPFAVRCIDCQQRKERKQGR